MTDLELAYLALLFGFAGAVLPLLLIHAITGNRGRPIKPPHPMPHFPRKP